MKIALFSATVLEYGGGLEKYLIETASNLAKMPGIKIDVITMDDSFMRKLTSILSVLYFKKIDKKLGFKENSKDINTRLGKAHYYKAHSIKDLRRRLNDYDVIYSKNELLEAAMFKFLLGYKKVPPVVFGGHTPLHYPNPTTKYAKLHNMLYTGSVYKTLAAGVARFHALNSHEEKIYNRLFPNKEIRKIYNPFDSSNFINQGKTHPLKIKLAGNKVNILWLGRLTEQKGISDLTEIIKNVNQNTDIKQQTSWTIVGDGEQRNLVEEVLKKHPNVHYLGHVEQKYTSSIYSQHHIFLNTSKWEGYPYTLLEAMSYNMPIIAYDIPGSSDVLSSYKNGYLNKNLSGMVNQLINITKSVRKEKKNSENFSPEHFKPATIYSKLISLLDIRT